jgi:hypothetical protein
MVTRAGTNQLHGSACEFIRQQCLRRPELFNTGACSAFHRNQYGGAVGGAVIGKTTIFFFRQLRGTLKNQGQTFIATVPDLNARLGFVPNTQGVLVKPANFNPVSLPYLNMYPVPNGRIFEMAPRKPSHLSTCPPTKITGWARMDFGCLTKTTLLALHDGYGTSLFRPGNVTADQENGAYHFVVLSESHIFSANSLNEIQRRV